jgi:hypothetical protein
MTSPDHEQHNRQGPRGGDGHVPYNELEIFITLRGTLASLNDYPDCPSRDLALYLLPFEWKCVQKEFKKNLEKNLACPKCKLAKKKGVHDPTELIRQRIENLWKDMERTPGDELTLELLERACTILEILEHNVLVDNFPSRCNGLFCATNPPLQNNSDAGRGATSVQ